MQVMYLQIAIRKGEQAVRESKTREMGLQGRLEKVDLELMDTKAEVADLQEMVEKGHQNLRESRMQQEMDQERLMIANRTTRVELKTVRNQLDIATCDLSDARKDKESLEVCYRSVRGMCSSMYAAVSAIIVR